MFFRKKKPRQQQEYAGKKDDGLVGSVFLAYGIVLVHIGIVALVGLLVLLLGGIANYFLWIVFGGAAMILGAAYYFLKKMTSEQEAIRRLMQLPEFRGKNIEISFLGGAASVKVGTPSGNTVDMKTIEASSTPLLETGSRSRLKDLGELSRLYENNMITADEYERLKKELLNSETQGPEEASEPDAVYFKQA